MRWEHKQLIKQEAPMLPAFIYNPVIYILAYSHILHLRICLRMLFSLLKYPILFLCKLYSSPSHGPPQQAFCSR